MYSFRNSHILMICSLTLVVGILLLSDSLTSSAEEPAKERISEKIVTRIHYSNVSFAGALHRLSIDHKFPICTEIPFSVTPPPGFRPPPGFEGKPQKETEENIPAISLDLSGKKVGEVLDVLMAAMNDKYYWSEDDRVINIIPVESKGNKSYLLNKQVANLRMNSQTPYQALILLLREVFPKQISSMESGGPLDPQNPTVEDTVDIDIKEGTLRQALNEIVREQGFRWAWNPRYNHFRLVGNRFWLFISMKKAQEDDKVR